MAAIVGILSLVATIAGVVVAMPDDGESPASSTSSDQPATPGPSGGATDPATIPSSAMPTAVTPDDAGGTNVCSISDSEFNNSGDVNLQCAAPLPASMAKVSFKLGSIFSALYLKPAAELPRPDAYPGYESGAFCHWWGEWPTTVPDLYLVDPTLNIEIEAGTSELVVLKEVRHEIFQRTPLKSQYRLGDNATLVNCSVGGGSNPGHLIMLDTAKSSVTLASRPADGDVGELGPEFMMPPASLSSKDVEYDSADLAIRSLDGYLYEGRIQILASLNGQARTLDIGSRTRPLRWISDQAGKYHPAGNPSRAWDSNKRIWIDGSNIYG
ncbi:hypothetical protein Q3V37_17705 [Micromonospora profundi]|uniref:Uncharacterized protein n=1 Tax=Micromonospora profundi TaxID=1420889 RepID=A0AAJ6HRG8_9ACTN|nr:hypothetical protein [Micromonospora profundi]WLS43255.1 hypothetical protein Q3V37_17705 [Micromonospora profundi]